MPFRRPFFEARDFDTVNLLSRRNVADFKSEQLVDGDKAQRLLPVDRKRPNRRTKGSDAARHGVRRRVGNRQPRRAQSGKVDMFAIKPKDGIVRPGPRNDFGDHGPVLRVDDMPVLVLERRQIDRPSIRRNRHSIATPVVWVLPQQPIRPQIKRH